MHINSPLIIAGVLITAAGFYRVVVMQNTTSNPTRVLVGGYVLVLIVSLFDLLGGGVGQLAYWILLLAFGTLLLTVLPDLGTRIGRKFVPA